jgi:hypothetical protein
MPGSDSGRDDFVDEHLAFELRPAEVLLVALPQIEEQTDGYEPEFLCIHTHLNCSIIVEQKSYKMYC